MWVSKYLCSCPILCWYRIHASKPTKSVGRKGAILQVGPTCASSSLSYLVTSKRTRWSRSSACWGTSVTKLIHLCYLISNVTRLSIIQCMQTSGPGFGTIPALLFAFHDITYCGRKHTIQPYSKLHTHCGRKDMILQYNFPFGAVGLFPAFNALGRSFLL